MGERKVLNKYYPPDFDPAKLPKIAIPKDRQYVVRLMAPFTMRCLTCGDYVYKGKKFNARKENALGETYLGIQIYRFYIRCPKCLSEITFKTDPENTDYAVEHGAYRTFQASRLAELEEERLQQEREEEEASNPMVALENRTKESRREMDVIDALEDIRDWNARNAQVKHEDLLDRHVALERRSRLELEREEEEAIEREFRKERMKIRRVGEEEEEPQAPTTKKPRLEDRVVRQSKKLTGLVKVLKNEKSKEVAVEKSEVTQEVAVEKSEVASSQPSGLHLTAYSDSEESN